MFISSTTTLRKSLFSRGSLGLGEVLFLSKSSSTGFAAGRKTGGAVASVELGMVDGT